MLNIDSIYCNRTYTTTHIFSNYGTCQSTVDYQAIIVQAVLCACFNHSNSNTATLLMVHFVTYNVGFIKAFFTFDLSYSLTLHAQLQFHLQH
jgi:hypothetical protein